MNNFDNEFEKAIRFVTRVMPPAEDLEKPTLLHSLRVSIYLWRHKYNRKICIGGLLHDVIEDANITKEEIENNFGKEIAEIVDANTISESLLEDKYKDLITRCIKYGQDALIIKAADVLDNFNYYTRMNNSNGLEYAKHIKSLLLEMKPESYKDHIFEVLRTTVS